MKPRMTRSFSIRIFAMSLIVFFSCQLAITTNVSAQEEEEPGVQVFNDNRISISPFRSVFSSLKFYDANDNTPLGEQSLSDIYQEGNTLWTPTDVDANHKAYNYPKVQMYVTEPFLVNSRGLNVFDPENEDAYIVDPTAMVNTMEQDPVTGEFIYIAKVNVAFDYLIKTVANLPVDKTYDFYPIDIMSGISASHVAISPITSITKTYTGTNIFAIGTGYTQRGGGFDPIVVSQNSPPNAGFRNPVGVIASSWDYGALSSSTSLEPTTWHKGSPENPVGIGFSLNNWKDQTSSQYDLANNYGNRGIKVVAKLDATAFPNPILYKYYREVNGQTFLVNSQGTEMGFYDAKLIPSLDKVGKVPAYIPPNEYFKLTSEGIKAQGSDGFGQQTLTSIDDTKPERSGYTFTYNYYYKSVSTYDVPAGSGGPIPTYIIGKPIGFPVQQIISSENFDVLPRTVTLTMTDTLKPYSTVSRTVYAGSGVTLQHFFLGATFNQQSTENQILWNDDIPYRMTIENTYIVHRVVLTCLVKSVNDILYIPTDGEPVAIENFQDYGINSLGIFNPNMNDISGTFSITVPQDIFSFLQGFLEDFWWLIVIVAVVIIVIAASAGARNPFQQDRYQQTQPNYQTSAEYQRERGEPKTRSPTRSSKKSTGSSGGITGAFKRIFSNL